MNLAIFVECFFIVFGVLLTKEFVEKKRSIQKFCLRKISRLYPKYILFGFSYFFLMYLFQYEGFCYWIKHIFLNLFGMQVLGIGDYGHNFGAVWYVAVLILVSAIVYSMLYVFEHKASVVLLWCCFFSYLYILAYNGDIICSWDSSRAIFSNMDVIRGFADGALGSLLYLECSNKPALKFGYI